MCAFFVYVRWLCVCVCSELMCVVDCVACVWFVCGVCVWCLCVWVFWCLCVWRGWVIVIVCVGCGVCGVLVCGGG